MDGTRFISRRFVLDALEEFLASVIVEEDHPCFLALLKVARLFAQPCSRPHVVEQGVNPCFRYIKALNQCESAALAGQLESALYYLDRASVLSYTCTREHLW